MDKLASFSNYGQLVKIAAPVSSYCYRVGVADDTANNINGMYYNIVVKVHCRVFCRRVGIDLLYSFHFYFSSVCALHLHCLVPLFCSAFVFATQLHPNVASSACCAGCSLAIMVQGVVLSVDS